MSDDTPWRAMYLDAMDRVRELEAKINTPHTADFIEAVRLEAAHQRERWGAAHDAGKADSDWFWLIDYVCGKAISKPNKQLHHIITTAAVCLNWHMARTVGNDMRPGIDSAPITITSQAGGAIPKDIDDFPGPEDFGVPDSASITEGQS